MSKIVYSCGTIQRLSAPCPAACIGCCAPDNADMPLAPTTQIFSNTATQLSAWAHAIAPAGSAAFDALAWVSLAFYLLFAVVALNYALKAWAEKAMAPPHRWCCTCLCATRLTTQAKARSGSLWPSPSICRCQSSAWAWPMRCTAALSLCVACISKPPAAPTPPVRISKLTVGALTTSPDKTSAIAQNPLQALPH